MSIFSANKILKTYQGSPVIEDVSLELNRGEVVCLLGASGIGKTTLFNVMSGLEAPDEGEVFLEGVDITAQPGNVSYMLQKDLLMPYKTVIDNVAIPLVLKGENKKVAREIASEFFDKFGLKGYENFYPNQLSGGMRQRAALLRTYLNHKEVVLLDEPFSALDSLTKMEMHRWFLEIFSQLNISAIFITHDIDEAIFLSDRIYIMSGRPGKITYELTVPYERPREIDFYTSPVFNHCKKEILSNLKCIDLISKSRL